MARPSLRLPTLALAALAALLAVPAVAPAQVAPTKRDLSKGNTLYVIPYSHLDTQWRWAYPQVIREYIPSTMRDNLALIAKYPGYVFNFSGSRRYEMMKEYYPEDYARVTAAVKAGRWFPCGSSVDEGDANVPSAESLVRHVLYGNGFFRREFGTASREFMLPDCFGFPYALPTVLAHCGLAGFSTQKLTWGSAVGIPFKVGVWNGPDGKGVVAALDPGSYGGDVAEDLSQNTSWLARIQNTGRLSGAYTDYHYYGTGDRGGAPNESSVAWVEKSLAGKGPIKVVTSRADEMFLNVTPAQRAKMPVYNGELLLTEHSAGSVTSEAYMKRWNRKNELLADAAERASVGAMWLGSAAYPSDLLYRSWDLLLGSQMHDMLPGTSLPKAYELCWNDEVLAMNGFAEAARSGVGAVAASLDTRAPGVPLVVYNPLSRAREDVVEMDAPRLSLAEPNSALAVFGPDGKALPTQRVGGKLLFRAKVPATGFAAFDVRAVPVGAGASPLRADEGADGRTIENERLKVTVNAAGDVASIYDKAARREVLKAPARLDFQYHNPSAFPAWNMDWSDAQKPPYGHVGGPAKIRIVENGPVRVAIEVDRTTAGSRFVQTIRLTAGGDRVEIANRIDWNTRETALKASFPFAAGNPKATYDLQVGTIQRGNNDPKKYEVPLHQWMDLTAPDGAYGAAILNDSKFGSDKPDDDTLRLTLLYTPGVRGGYQDQATQDFGRHDILYAVAPHAGDWRDGDVAWNAKRLNQPLRAFVVPAHAGPSRTLSLASTDLKAVEISAMKKAEASGEIVVRLRELEGKDHSGATLTMAAPILSARELNGQEEPLNLAGGSASAEVVDGKLRFGIGSYSLKTFALRLAAPNAAGRSAKPAAPTSRPVPLAYDVDAAAPTATAASLPETGGFDGEGRTYPAEMLPATLDLSGTRFALAGGKGKTGAKTALTSRGQTIALPDVRPGDRIEMLLASSGGDVDATFRAGDQSVPVRVQDWRGYVGQWDDRLWIGPVPELAYNWDNPWGGLVPGFVKPAAVAWYASHHNEPGAGPAFYGYCQIFRAGMDLPKGATSVTLPNDPRVKLFALTVVRGTHPATPATPLMEVLDRSDAGGPAITLPSDANLADTTTVTLSPPLYWRGNGLRYTLDGSPVTPASPLYAGPFTLNSPTTVAVAQFDDGVRVGPEVRRRLEVNDTTPPRVVAATILPALGLANATFSERVDRATAEDPARYRLGSGTKILAATLAPDGRSVELDIEPRSETAASSETLAVAGVKDLSPGANASGGAPAPVAVGGPILSVDDPGRLQRRDTALPRSGRAPWTINFLLKTDRQPEDRTLLAGFGRAVDGPQGTGRYIAKFSGGLHFWSADSDLPTDVPLDLGRWQMVTATYDGETLRLYKDGKPVASRDARLSDDEGVARVAPLDAWERKRRFDGGTGGGIQAFTVWNGALSPRAVGLLYGKTKRD